MCKWLPWYVCLLSLHVRTSLSGILKRTATEETSQHRIFDLGYHPTLVMLLSAHDSNVLQAVLVALVNLSSR